MTRRELEELLRTRPEPLPPQPGVWDVVRRRARRRRLAKLAAGAVAAVTVLGAGIPTALTLRAHQTPGKQRVSVASPDANLPAPPRPTPTVPPLQGFTPTSVSFVTQREGYLWGNATGSAVGPAIVAHTGDGGKSWARVAAPDVTATDAGGTGDSGITFASNFDGFAYGSQLFVTHDSARSWVLWPTPGHIVDLETSAGRIWALSRGCAACGKYGMRLFTATVGYPLLHRVRSVPVLHGQAAALTLDGLAAFVLTGRHDFYYSRNGRHWRARVNPCGALDSSAVLATTSSRHVVAVCGGLPRAGTQPKSAYLSTSAGRHWRVLSSHLPTPGYVRSLGQGPERDLILATSRGGGFASHDGGRTWSRLRAGGVRLGYVGFISAAHVIALPDETSPGGFLRSNDIGQTWHAVTFPR